MPWGRMSSAGTKSSWLRRVRSVQCCNYLRNVDERPPFREAPRCQVDGRTKYRRVRRGRRQLWECPKHPRECTTEKVVPGDPA